MPSALPSGEPAPADGALPDEALAELGSRPFGFYVHVPFCTVRCGYCDFNTYTAEDLGRSADMRGASRSTYAEAAIDEVRLARRVLRDADLPVSTVFFGGGTPTLLKPGELGAVLAAIAAEFGLAPDIEVTTEANPDSVALWDLEELRQVGFDRISFGMQSDVPHVLATLDRTHDPLRVPAVVGWARQAGFEQVSLDLIYGTPGESLADWETSLDAALACAPEHVSAYSLIVEEGTALARRIDRGELATPDEDDLADKYLLADERLAKAGLGWYEVSNWARDERSRCRHNIGLLDRRRLVGRRPGRPLARRRRSVVERQAPRGVRRTDQLAREPGARARGARRRDPAGGAGAARAPPVRRPSRRGPGRHRTRRDLRPRRARPARPGR